MTDDQREANEYLLDQMRRCGLFKCQDCLYALWEDSDYGLQYKCEHPRTLPHSAWRDVADAYFGSACDVFEPTAKACENVAERMSETTRLVRRLAEYAWAHTEHPSFMDTPNETFLRRLHEDIRRQGIVRL